MPATTAPAAITTWRPIFEPGQHDRAVAEPAAVADRDRLVLPHLGPDRQVEVFVAVVLIGDVHVVAGPDVVADLDALVADDADALAERAAITDR